MIDWGSAPADAEGIYNNKFVKFKGDIVLTWCDLTDKWEVSMSQRSCFVKESENYIGREKMITDLRVGDYIEKSELDTEQKYNDVVEIFKSFGFEWGENAAAPRSALIHNAMFLTCCDDGLWHTTDKRWNKRKLTYNEIMSLKKVDVDNCNIDKVVSGEVIKPYDPRKILQSCKDKEMESLYRFITGDNGDTETDKDKRFKGSSERKEVVSAYMNDDGEGFIIDKDIEKGEIFREDPTAKEMLKSAKAVLAMESLGHEWDEEKGQWFRKEYF